MKNIAYIFERINQELSEQELKDLLISIDQIIVEKAMDFVELEAELQLIQSVKICFNQRLGDLLVSNLENDIIMPK